MTAPQVLSWSGLALTLVGTAIAAIGILETWRQFRSDGARFWAPFYDWADRRVGQPARSFGRTIERRWNRMLGRVERRSTTVRLGQAIETEIAMPITVFQGNGESVDPKDAVAFAAFMQKDLAIQRARMQLVEQRADAERTQRKAAIDQLQRQLDDRHDRLRDMAQQVAVSGLPLEMTGIFLVILGTLSQAIAQLIK